MNTQDIKDVLRRVLSRMECIDYYTYVPMDENAIKHYSDMDYRGGAKEVLVVVYKSEYNALPRYVWAWEFTRPDELANSLEI